MGNALEGAARQCRNFFHASTSRSLADQETPEQRAEREKEILRLQLQREREVEERRLEELRLAEERKKREVHERVATQVSYELQDLRKSIQQLSTDLHAPGAQVGAVSEDHKKEYTRLDDYVHETMYALLLFLSTKEDYAKSITMAQLLFFLKSPYIHQRKKYLLSVERLLRTVGLSLFEKDQSIEPLELAKVFDVRSKRISQSSKLERLVEIERRSAWHALD